MLATVVDVFATMHRSGAQPDQFSFSTVLSATARMNSFDNGRAVHCQIVKSGLESVSFCEGALINMYAKCGSTSDARRVFDAIEWPDTISWTAVIEGYVCIGQPEEALKMFQRMLSLGMEPDNVTYVTVITACLRLGMLEDARNLCRHMPLPDVVAWNAIISGHAKNGYEDEALDLFREMRACDVKPTRSTLGSILSVIASLTALDEGRAVHSETIRLGLDLSVYVGSSLINMYAKCQLATDARRIFDTSSERNIVMWNSMIGGYLQNQQPSDAIGMFLEMTAHGSEFDEFTLVSLFGACASLECLGLGRQLHCIVIKKNLKGNLIAGNAAVDMYAKCGELTDAMRKFELIPHRDIVSWNSIIAGCVHNDCLEDAIWLFQRMRSEEVMPDESSFASVISACSTSQAFDEGTQFHSLAIKCNLASCPYMGSSLVDMYAKFGELGDANKLFMEMPERTVASRNALIAGYAQNNKEQEALDLFRQMKIEGTEPSRFTYASVLPACNGIWGLHMGKEIHCNLLKSGLFPGYAFLEVLLLSMYLKATSLEDANKLFLEISESSNKVLWTAIISGHALNGNSKEALTLFWKMRNHNICSDDATFSSVLKACADLASLADGKEVHGLAIQTGFSSYRYTSSALVDMYSKCGDVGDAFQVFEELNRKDDIILWNPMIGGFAKNGFAEEALMLFHEMQVSKITPDDVTFLGVLTACSHAGLVSQGCGFFELMSKKYGIIPRADHYTCMVDVLGRRGHLRQAEEFINRLPFEPDGAIWATMLSACRVHGDELRGKHAAEKLIKLEPQSSSPYVLLSHIYAASGNWSEAKMLRQAMRERGIRKSPGCSWIDVGNTTNLFVAEDKLNPRAIHIYKMLDYLNTEMKEEGYLAETDLLMLDEGCG